MSEPETRARAPRMRLLVIALLACLPLGFSIAWFSGAKPSPPPPASNAIAAVAKGRVDIEGGLIRLAASRDGLITAVLVEEGDRVRKGQILCLLDDRAPRLAHDLAHRETEQLRAQLPAVRLKAQGALREERRLEGLVSQDSASRQELDQARDLRAQLDAELVAQEAALATALAREKQAGFEVDQRVIRAPLEGRVVRRMARPGDGVSTLNVTPLFLFAPEGPRIVRAELEESFLGSVEPGQEVGFSLESDEQRGCAGRVLRVGKVVGPKTGSDDLSERMDTRIVECVLSLEDQSLLIGQRVIVRFKQVRR